MNLGDNKLVFRATICFALASFLAACQQAGVMPAALEDGKSSASEPVEITNHMGAHGNLASLTQVIKRNPNDAGALNLRGTAHGRARSYTKALKDFNRALSIKPDYHQALANRALIYVKTRQYKKAMADYNEALRLKPDYGIALVGRGNLFARNKSYELAIADFNRAIELQSDNAIAWFSRGKIYQIRGQHQRALQDLDQAIALKPISSEPYFRRGLSRMELGMLNEAYDDFFVAGQRNKKHYAAWTYRGLAAERMGKKKKAARAFRRALSINSGYKPAKEGLRRVGDA